MKTKVTKWGNSLALRIPQGIAKKYHFYDGAQVEVRETTKGALILGVKEPHTMGKLPTLKDVLVNFSPNMIEDVQWGNDVGKEILK
ncbi:MAG: hypothetical protein ABI430_04155 [Candidatus Taylorbacteria bacterium]